MEFTVIVPVYKVEQYIRPCVDGILAQTYADFELILVDDGSPDGCPAICDEYARQDARVTVIHKENGGLAAARSSGLDVARGAYTCFVDSDDRVTEDWLETIKRHIDEGGRPDMLLFGYIWDYETHTEPSPPDPAPGLYDKARLEAELYPRMLYDRSKPFFQKLVPSYICAKAAKTELWREHYVSDGRITIYEDGAMVYECLYFARSVYVCPECLYYYRQRQQSIMGSYHAEYTYNLSVLSDYIHEHLGVLSADLDEQRNAYIVMRSINAVAQEFIHGNPLRTAARNVRREMNASGLPEKLRMRGLPLYIRAFVLLLKLRLYFTASLLTRLRLAQTEGQRS